jgi:ATP-dependent Clp protease ATP-binding subunit ClpA
VRRFQKIDVNEPTVEDTIEILRGPEALLRGASQAQIHQRGDQGGGELSARYINDRKLPDKAIDVIDESGAAQMLLPENKRARRRHRQGDRERRRHDGAHSAEERVEGRPSAAHLERT